MRGRALWFDRQGNPISIWQAEQLLSTPGSRNVAQTIVGDRRVSTVHLVLDHSFTGTGPPVLFETMVFGPPDAEGVPEALHQQRYCTEPEALAGHDQVVAWVRDGMPDE